ncbi:MAG: HEPN domain-containing protein [Syntrophobacteraceae bacterium]|nr:HEPN domain-containing protein [Syntrophobacteraceae bacterium]
MGNRAADWLHQAEGDLRHAVHAREDGDHDWSCFAAHQAAEKAVKALILCRGGEGWGHSVTRLLKDLARVEEIPDAVLKSAMRLDKHYIPTRYPNGFDVGAPREYYTDEDSEKAIQDAERVYGFCRQSFLES